MVSVTNESLDVSCRATAHTVQFFIVHNHPVSKLIEGIPQSLAHLENVAASISWDHYLRFLNNTRQVLPDSQWQIELRRMLSGSTLLSVSDNGVGLPAAFDIESEKSLGLRLDHLLTRQIGGQLSVINAAGTTFTIEIPYEN